MTNVTIPAGYKQTEVGIIPEDWNVIALSRLGSFSKGMGIKKDDANTGDFPCVRYGELYTHHNDVIRCFLSHVSPSIAKQSKRLRKNSILFAGSGETKEEIGKCAAFVDDFDVFAGGDIVILELTDAAPDFLGYLLNSPIISRQKASNGQGDAVVHISSKALGSIKIPYPQKKEQTAIASVLSDVDALIASLNAQIAKKRDIKTSTMQQLLTGKQRLAGFGAGKGMKASELGEIPEDWEVVPINNLSSTVASGKSRKSDSFGKYLLYGSTGVIGFCEKPDYSGEVILIARVGANAGAINLVSGEYGVSDNAIILALANNCDNFYILYQLCRKNLNSLVFGSGQPLITGTQIKNLKIPYPVIEEQAAIAAVLSDMDAEITALEQRLGKVKSLKQGMMQELLTGRTRLV